MRVALVHDYLIQDGGAERVLQAFHEIWPDAPTFVLLHDPKRMQGAFRDRDIRTSFLQKFPFALTKYKWLLPLMPAATEHHDLSGFDVVVTSTSAFAKGVITRPETLHVCYCHTPTRYLWSDTHSYVGELGLPSPIRQMMPMMLSRLRVWDRLAADRVDRFIANSKTVQGRIRKYYQRDSELIYPPVDTTRYSIIGKTDGYYLAGGRLVAYKRFDLIVRAFNELGLRLKVFGIGPEMERLRAIAGPHIEFVGRVNEQEKADLYARAVAYIHPQEEDFGITAVEAMAAGRPVIAYAKGGALETVIPGVTGEFITEQTPEALAGLVRRFDPSTYEPKRIREHAIAFDIETFKDRMRQYVEDEYARMREGAPTLERRIIA